MKKISRTLCNYFCIVFISSQIFSQTPGIIVRPAGGVGVSVLDPNGDGFTSATNSGFTTSDIVQSEIAFKAMSPVISEPTNDLLRGPGDKFTDIVTSASDKGLYVYGDGTNLLFRLRMGGIVSGSKGYSVMIDTDNKFGAAGPYADPNFVPKTTGTSGNPGFEIEVVFETNFRIAVYNVDGSSSPTPPLLSSYSLNTYSQISVALTQVSGDADYFYDFYVPFSILGVSSSTPLRMVSTTVMSPQGAIGGPMSDVYGMGSFTDIDAAWTTLIENTPPVTFTDLSNPGYTIPAPCTPAPSITTSTIEVGSNKTVTGSWTRLDASKPSTAMITLYKNGASAGTTTATTAVTWSITGITMASGDIFYAKAQSTGESQCLQSSSIKAIGCNSSNTSTTTGLTFTCISAKGMEGGRPTNAAVKLYTISTSGVTLLADDNSTANLITYPTSTTWRYDAANGQGNPSACSGGANDVSDGQYAITATESGKCESKNVLSCLTFSAQSAPVITQTILYNGNSTVSGTVSTSGSLVRLYRNGVLETSVTATGTSYSFLSLTLTTGDLVEVTAQATGGCMSAATSRTVYCYTPPPTITATPGGNLIVGATTISGTSGEAAGTTVTIYENAVSIGTATVQSNATWSLTYTVLSAKSYYATQQVSGCTASTQSATAAALSATTVCPTINGSYTENSTTISGTTPSGFTGTIRLYMDGTSIASTTMSGGTTWNIAVNQNTTTYIDKLYPGAVLTVSSQATGAAEKTDCSSTVTVSCATPATPVISPTSISINGGQTVTFTVQNAQSGMLFSIRDNADATNLGVSKFGAGSNLTLTSTPFNVAGVYTVRIKSTSFSGVACESYTSATITVLTTLPVSLLSFEASYANSAVSVSWKTVSEQNVSHYDVERSYDGNVFNRIGTVNSGNYSSAHQYSFVDNNIGSDIIYYRLKIVDVDGKTKYSKIVAVRISKLLTIETIQPNPFKDGFEIKISSVKETGINIRLADITGQIVSEQKALIRKGNNTIHMTRLEKLQTGVYLLMVKSGEQIFNIKLIKE